MVELIVKRKNTDSTSIREKNRASTWNIFMSVGIIILLFSIFLSPYGVRHAEAWEKDAHFYLIYYLSIATCFEPREAYLIALGDWSVDTFHGTSPLPTLSDVKNRDWSRFINSGRNYHALGEAEEVMKRYNYLRSVALDGLKNPPDPNAALVKFGVYLHFRQDMVSHLGYKPPLGHLLATILNDDPDSLATNPAKTSLMVNYVVDDLITACNIMKRQSKDPRGTELSNFINNLIKGSDPTWKRQRTRIALAVASTVYGGPLTTMYKLYTIYTILGNGRYYRSIIERNAKLIGIELGKLQGAGPASIPPSHTIDVNAVMSERGGKLVYLGVSDPPDAALFFDDILLTVANATLTIKLNLTIYNAGDTSLQNTTGSIAVLAPNGDFIDLLNLPEESLSSGDRVHYNTILNIPLDLLSNGTTLIYGVVDGGPEDPYFENNVIIIAFDSHKIKQLISTAPTTYTSTTITYTTTYVNNMTIPANIARTIQTKTTIQWRWLDIVLNHPLVLSAVLLIVLFASIIIVKTKHSAK